MTTIFDKCKDIIDERGNEYGDLVKSFNRIASYWSIYLDTHITSKDVSMMMALLKMSREQSGHKEDNIIDLINYVSIANELEKNKE